MNCQRTLDWKTWDKWAVQRLSKDVSRIKLLSQYIGSIFVVKFVLNLLFSWLWYTCLLTFAFADFLTFILNFSTDSVY